MSESPERDPLIERQDAAGASTSGAPHAAKDLQPELDQDGVLELTAQRVVTYTLWFLLGAVLIGTVVGVILVSIPLQNGDPPPVARKAAALLVLQSAAENLQGAGSVDSSQAKGVSRALLSETARGTHASGPQAVVWSGKGHGKELVFNDMHFFDLATRRWKTAFNLSTQQGEKLQYPAPRWKTLALREPATQDMIVFGGDPLSPDQQFLNDLWRLEGPSQARQPVWTSVSPANTSSDSGRPVGRRAHAGVIVSLNGSSTLAVHGGKRSNKDLLADLWTLPLDNQSAAWERRFPLDEDALMGAKDAEANEADRKHKKKRKRVTGPSGRKGHLAVLVPNRGGSKMVIWGGRNDTAYFSDLWAFDFATNEWELWGAEGRTRPSGRDHLGGFYLNGTIFIYGGRGGINHEKSTPLGDMWAFDIEQQLWREVKMQGEQPAPRFLHGLDVLSQSQTAKMVIFGGETHDKCYLNDVWEFTVANASWALRSKPVPDRRKKHCAKLVS